MKISTHRAIATAAVLAGLSIAAIAQAQTREASGFGSTPESAVRTMRGVANTACAMAAMHTGGGSGFDFFSVSVRATEYPGGAMAFEATGTYACNGRNTRPSADDLVARAIMM